MLSARNINEVLEIVCERNQNGSSLLLLDSVENLLFGRAYAPNVKHSLVAIVHTMLYVTA